MFLFLLRQLESSVIENDDCDLSSLLRPVVIEWSNVASLLYFWGFFLVLKIGLACISSWSYFWHFNCPSRRRFEFQRLSFSTISVWRMISRWFHDLRWSDDCSKVFGNYGVKSKDFSLLFWACIFLFYFILIWALVNYLWNFNFL